MHKIDIFCKSHFKFLKPSLSSTQNKLTRPADYRFCLQYCNNLCCLLGESRCLGLIRTQPVAQCSGCATLFNRPLRYVQQTADRRAIDRGTLWLSIAGQYTRGERRVVLPSSKLSSAVSAASSKRRRCTV